MKLLSIFLVLVLLVNMLPMGVFAQEVREDILSTENRGQGDGCSLVTFPHRHSELAEESNP